MKSESDTWAALRPLIAELDPVRIENRVGSGVPDINTTSGWIELKYLSGWPKKAETPVRIPHYTAQQRLFAVRRTRAGGKCFLLIHIEPNEWLLFDGATAAAAVGTANREELYQRVLVRWIRKPKKEELIPWLKN